MKIINLQVENIKKLVAVEITPTGNMVKITGKNGAGKSSVLDSIFWALAGTKNHQSMPIRNGESEATIVLNLGDIIVRRQFKDGNSGITTKLIVENRDGARFPSPQVGILDDMLGPLTFDPLEFSRMKKEEKFETLRSFVTDIDWESEDMAHKTEFDLRREQNRIMKDCESKLGSKIEAMDKMVQIDSSIAREKLTSWSDRSNQNNEIEKKRLTIKNKLTEIQNDKSHYENEIIDLEHKLNQIHSHLETLTMEHEDTITSLAHLPNPQELEPIKDIQDQIDVSRYHNDRVKVYETGFDAFKESQKYTELMNNRKKRLTLAVQKANMPVDGISFQENEIFLNGIPLDQASDAEQLRLSCAIAMSQNSKLRVIRVKNGSLLDEESLKIFQEMADKHDYQVWIERVDTTGKVGFVIEDGQLANNQ